MTSSATSPLSRDQSIAGLVGLIQRGDHPGVIARWEQLAPDVQRLEIAARLAASAFARLGQLQRADAVLTELIASGEAVEAPTFALAGRIAYDLQRYDDSIVALERALAMRSEPMWWLWLADAAIKAAQPQRALALSSRFSGLFRDHVDLAITQATLLAHAGSVEAAREQFVAILSRWPHHAIAGPGYAEFVMREYPTEALALLRESPWRPQWNALSAEQVRATLWLPAFYLDHAAADEWRARLLSGLHELTTAARRSSLTGDARAACLATTPFFVAFHEADVTPIQLAWGDFVEAVVAPLRGELGLAERPDPPVARPVRRIGIVSNRITSSSAGRFFNGWIDELAAAGFDIRLYALGNTDQVTASFAQRFALKHFPHDESTHWRNPAEVLRDDDNDLLLFPEPQGSQLIMLLAGLRLAPIQCAAFGNPLTTGLHTIDYFLSPDAAEVEDPTAHYRERVIRLAGMGTRVTADIQDELPTVRREDLGLATTDTLYLVSQQLQKWSPTFVDLLAKILQSDRRARVAYFDIGGAISVRAFQDFLRAAMRRHGIEADARFQCLPVVSRSRFLAINECADFALDTVSFGGGSTTFDALSVGLPVVTLSGAFLRSRQTSAMLQLCGLQHLVNGDVSSYVNCALTQAHAGRQQRQRPSPDWAAVQHDAGKATVFRDAATFFSSLR